jgi:hypothetical protein
LPRKAGQAVLLVRPRHERQSRARLRGSSRYVRYQLLKTITCRRRILLHRPPRNPRGTLRLFHSYLFRLHVKSVINGGRAVQLEAKLAGDGECKGSSGYMTSRPAAGTSTSRGGDRGGRAGVRPPPMCRPPQSIAAHML